MRKIIASLVSAVALVAALPHSSPAITLYGTAYVGPNTAEATLYSIDPDVTAGFTPIGLTGYNRVSGIDFDPFTGTLYGVGVKVNDGIGGFELITIDITTGVGTSVGLTGVFSPFQDISFRSDGTLFGFSAGNLYTLDLTMGTATLVGPTGVNPTGGNATAFDPSNVLYNINGSNISTLNQTNGAATDTMVDVDYPVEIGTDPRANAMDYDLTSGILYASVVHGIDGPNANFIARIDLATGDVSNVHATVLGLDAIAVRPELNGRVPEGGSTLWLALPLLGFAAVKAATELVARMLVNAPPRSRIFNDCQPLGQLATPKS